MRKVPWDLCIVALTRQEIHIFFSLACNCRCSKAGRQRHLQKEVQQWSLVAQIHDELLFEIEEGALPAAARLIQQCMEEAAPLSVPLRVKMSVGPSWGSLLPYTHAPKSNDVYSSVRGSFEVSNASSV